MTVRVDVEPELLQWAVERSGRADEELWTKSFPRSRYEAWVTRAARPTLTQLDEFAAKTHTPVGFLYLDEPPIEDMPITDFRTMNGEPTGVISVDLRETIYTCQARQDWYREHRLIEGEPPLEFVGSVTLEDDPAAVAALMVETLGWDAEARRQAGDQAGAVAALRDRAEAIGVLVVISGIVGSNTRRKLDPEEFRGFALADPLAALVFVNGADSKSAQMFTLAHELAHVWLGATGLSDIEIQANPAGNTPRELDTERWCNRVAAELLKSKGSGGNFYNTKPVQMSKRLAREFIASTLEGRTPYTDAFRLLNIKKQSTFDNLGEKLGVI